MLEIGQMLLKIGPNGGLNEPLGSLEANQLIIQFYDYLRMLFLELSTFSKLNLQLFWKQRFWIGIPSSLLRTIGIDMMHFTNKRKDQIRVFCPKVFHCKLSHQGCSSAQWQVFHRKLKNQCSSFTRDELVRQPPLAFRTPLFLLHLNRS